MRSTLRSVTFVGFALLVGCPSPARMTDSGVVDAFREDTGMITPMDSGGVCTTPGTEDNLAACSDSCDNDSNGFVDCSDFACCASRTDCPAGTACGDVPDAGMPMVVTIEQLQDRADPAHPATGARISVTQAGMVALTPRVLVGSMTGGSSMMCRFSIWVGAMVSGDFTAIQVQENLPLTAGMTSCFDLPEDHIPLAFEPGDTVTAINNATYTEFCASAMGTTPDPCTDYEISSIFLGGTARILRGAAGTAPVGTVVGVGDIVAAMGAPGPRAVALEGGLLAVEDVQIGTRADGAFTQYFGFLASAPTEEIDLVIANFPNTMCVRMQLDTLATGTTTVGSITGVLLPNFGRWSLRVRDEADLGITCP